MKTTSFCFLMICWLTQVGQSFGQDDSRASRNDPTYSTRNYKHANKAATARRWQTKAGVVVQPPMPGQTNMANYKRQLPGQAPVGGVTVAHTPSTNVADRNYKIQRPTQSVGPAGSTVAGKKRSRPDSSGATGD